MPIRIRCPDKSLDRPYVMETTGMNASSPAHFMASYTDKKPALRILCGSA
jgi:hypothetical protein